MGIANALFHSHRKKTCDRPRGAVIVNDHADNALATPPVLGHNTVRARTVHTPQSVGARDATSEYRKLVAALASRAVRIGSRDAEGAAHETLRRSLANQISRAAVEYYLRERLPDLPD